MVAFPVVLPMSSKVMKDGGYTFGDFARYGGLIQVGAWVGMGKIGFRWIRWRFRIVEVGQELVRQIQDFCRFSRLLMAFYKIFCVVIL